MNKVVASLLVYWFSAFSLYADEAHPHPVIFPNLAPPFDQVVDLAFEGIQEVIPLVEKHSYSDSIISGDKPLILTNRAKREYEEKFGRDSNLVVGLAELRQSEPIYGVSFFIEPELYIDQVLSVSNQINKIIFFHNDARSTPPDVDELEQNFGIHITSVAASHTEDALRAFARENSTASSNTAFVFVRGFIELNTDALLEFIVRESWESGAITIGNKASYVKAGMTLGLMPDFKAYGQQIARLMIEAERENFQAPRVTYLQTKVNALNTRSSLRSNIFANEKLKARFKYSYPVQ